MREKIIAATLLMASLAFAQFDTTDNNSYFSSNESSSTYSVNTYSTNSNPVNTVQKDPYYQAHRGFYFSTSITFGYTYHRKSETDLSSYHYSKDQYKYTGFLTPYEEIRLGGSIANVASIYGALGMGVGTGTLKTNFYDEESRSYYYDSYNQEGNTNTRINDYDATDLKFLFGLGTEIYPVQDKESPMYGFFLGLAYGLTIDAILYDKYDSYYSEEYDEAEGFFNMFLRFEVGKDFWFSRRWSFGVAFNYTMGWFTFDDDEYYSSYRDREHYTSHTFGLSIRITH